MNDALEPDGEPGETWHYNTPVYQHLVRILALKSGLDVNAMTQA